MIVCVCNRYSDRDVIDAAQAGATSAEEAYAQLGKPACCGCCLEMADMLVDGVTKARSSTLMAAE